MVDDDLGEIGLALARGDTGLLLGPDWQPPSSPAELDRVASIGWLGVWSESVDGSLAHAIDAQLRIQGHGRLVIEVPGRIGDSLAEYYKLAEVCPFFYLAGRPDACASLSPRQRERIRGDKLAELNRLGPGVLVVAGFSRAMQLSQILKDEVTEEAPELRLLFVCGIEPHELARIRSDVPSRWADRLRGFEFDLPSLIRVVEERRQVAFPEPYIRIGSSLVPVQSLLRSEPPIDQDYVLLTAFNVRDPEADEDQAAVLTDLIAGREPWRAFARSLAWKRPSAHSEKFRQLLRRASTSERRVHVVEVPAEAGSGLTTLLQQMAFEAARSGHPTLLHRARDNQFDYNMLRRFLTDLYQSPNLAQADFGVPAVVVFDAPSVEADALEQLYDLPERLAKDDRRVVIVRATASSSVQQSGPRGRPRYGQVAIPVERLDSLRAALSQKERESLALWARAHDAFALPAADTIRNWDDSPDGLPLMIALYFILTEDLRSVGAFGRHLLATFKRWLPNAHGDSGATSSEFLSAVEVRSAALTLSHSLGRRFAEPEPTSAELSAVFLTLSALGCLRLVVPRNVLADMAGIPRSRVHDVLSLLERADLVTNDLQVETSPDPNSTARLHAPVAYYTIRGATGLRHPAYGRLALEWLASQAGAEDRASLAETELGRQILAGVPQSGHLERYPIRPLRPLLARLDKPREHDHVRFVAYVALRYLRLPKKYEKRRSDLAAWQWANAPLLLDVLSWVSPQVAGASVITLHSRGITRYKTATRQEEYRDAERDFLAAIDLARKTYEEHPVYVLTSLGLLYRGWARWERDHGSPERFQEIDRKTERTLREALAERPDSPFAAFGLARYLVDCFEEESRGLLPDQRARALAEAVELLQLEPEANFQDEWEELYSHAVGLLCESDAVHLIDSLICGGDELGYALKALRALEGYIPASLTEDSCELAKIREASQILVAAEQAGPLKRSPLADLLRYVVFSADGSARKDDPAFLGRFELIRRLVGTIYLERPLWLYDYAALAFQVGQYREAADAFARLRRGQRYFEVSKDRGHYWTESPNSVKPRLVFIRVINAGQGDERGWARIERPSGYRDLVPFSVRAFQSRGKATRVGSGSTSYIRLNPAGPYAEPDVR